MGAITLVARAELRRCRAMVLLLTLVAALVSAAVLTAAAGSRRTATALDRMLEKHPEPTLLIGVSQPRFASDMDQIRALQAELQALPGLDDIYAAQIVFAGAAVNEDFMLATGPDDRYVDELDLYAVEGRMPLTGATGEVALNEAAADTLGFGVGDVLVVPTMSPQTAVAMFSGEQSGLVTDGPELELAVVGVYRDTSALDVDAALGGVTSPDVGSLIGSAAALEVQFYASADAETVDLDRATAIVSNAVPDAWVYTSIAEVRLEPLRRSFDSIAAGLAVFALVALVAGLIALGLVISRQLAASQETGSEARALGMARSSLALATALPAVLASVAGVVVGVVVAVLLSPLFPISVARRAEVDPGIRVDASVLVAVSVVLVAVASLWAFGAGWRLTRTRPRSAASVRAARWVRVRRALPVAAGLGCTSVVAPPRGRAGVRAGSAVFGAVVGIAGVVAIAVFATSQRAAADDPSRYGWNWDSMPDLFYAGDPWPVVGALAEDPRIDAVGGAFCDTVFIGDSVSTACALQVLSGSLTLTYSDGRAPSSPDEVAVGERTLGLIGADIGDTIAVTGESGATTELVVVGSALQPDTEDLDEGLVVSEAGFEELADDFFQQFLVLRYPEGSDIDAVEESLAADYPLEFTIYSRPRPPQSLSQLERVRPTLAALAGFLGVIGVVGLLHFLLLSGSRRRHETGVLKAIGFVRRQTGEIVAWQAVTIAVLGVVVGVPLGVIGGRAAWLAAIGDAGIIDTPTMPWAMGALIVGGTLIGAVGVALVPAWLTARRSPAEALRSE